MNWLSGLLTLAFLLAAAPIQAAEEPEDKYLRILSAIDQAETLQTRGKGDPAKAKYQQAQRGLLDLKQNHPIWNPKVVDFRLKYLAAKISGLSQPPPGPGAAEAAGTETKSATTASAGSSDPQVKLLNAGAEPRRPLRIQAKPGDTQKAGLTMKMDMNMEMGGMPAQVVKLPSIKMGIDLTVQDVATNGDISYESVLGDATVADEPGVIPQVAEAMRTSFAATTGLSGKGTISSRGLGKKSDLKLPVDADPQTRQAMEQMNDSFATFTTIFPEEAVGPGARWEVRLPIQSQGMTITQTTTHELTSIEGDQLKLKTALVQHAANQKIKNPAMPELQLDLTKMTGSGNGTSTINLAHILPSQATMETKSEVVMAMNMGGQKQTMTMKMDLNLLLGER